MSTTTTCPNCHSPLPRDAPAGVCPACALRAGLLGEASAALPPTRTASSWSRGVPDPGATLPADELARRLPELDDFQLLGRGGMGTVYRAVHRKLQRPVAVKILDASLQDHAALGAAFSQRFTREARTLARLDHPNVVRVYDFGHRSGLFYLVMELVDGVDLRQVIQGGGLEPAEALALIPQICAALQYAHDQGVVHRDIKPENILVDRRGTVKIADFGLAKLLGSAGETDARLTLTRQVMGTPHYMAPEQIEHPEQVDHRADIFALGVVFYELLTGELPVGRFPVPSLKVEIDARVDEVVLRTLEKEPSLRYQRASDLSDDVESVASRVEVVEDSSSTPSVAPASRGAAGSAGIDFEYRSDKTVFGLPLVHIAFSRDPSGTRMLLASGIIAIGDMAIGGVAIGGFSLGILAVGGISAGLLSFGGLAVALLFAMGGLAVGGFAFGGMTIGALAVGAVEVALWTLDEAASSRAKLFAWLLGSLVVTTGAWAAIYAWLQAVRKQR